MKWKTVVFVFAVVATMVMALGATPQVGIRGAARIVVGPVCFPNEPCGGGFEGANVAAGPVCYPGDPCGLGQKKVAAGPVCYPGDPCGLGNKG